VEPDRLRRASRWPARRRADDQADGGGVGAAAVSIVGLRALGRRAADRLLDAPSVAPREAAIAGELDALGGEVIRLRSRDGLRLAGRWLRPTAVTRTGYPIRTRRSSCLHGYSGSSRRTSSSTRRSCARPRTSSVSTFAGTASRTPDRRPSGCSKRGHRGRPGLARGAWHPTGRAVRHVDGWHRGDHCRSRVLGDGTLGAADAGPDAPRADVDAPRPLIAAVVADSVSPEPSSRSRTGGCAHRAIPGRAAGVDTATRRLGADPRDTEPHRVRSSVAPGPLLLINGEAGHDRAGRGRRRLGGRGRADGGAVDGPGADHSRSHAVAGTDYERG
jgi:hypothetical protein